LFTLHFSVCLSPPNWVSQAPSPSSRPAWSWRHRCWLRLPSPAVSSSVYVRSSLSSFVVRAHPLLSPTLAASPTRISSNLDSRST
ncbi:hypothetical protein PFISCL1PPCAC_8853, partial [Pristionchus fissidentatus]